MKISVVTISFNQAEYLEQAISSVLQQSDCEFEYIVVDAGSTDGSREIIQRMAAQIDKLVLEPDDGAADGLNKGFAQATGEIFCYLNSDDVFLPGALARANEIFRRHPETEVVCGNAFIINSKGETLRRVYSDVFGLRAVAYGSSIQIQPSTFFRASAFRAAGGFNVANRSTWDGELVVDMALAGASVRTVADFFSAYRVHAQSITGSGRLAAAQQRDFDRMFCKIIGRERLPIDTALRAYYRLKKHLGHPRATYERLVHGPVYGSCQEGP